MNDFEIAGELWRIVFVRPSDPVLQRSDGSWTVGATDASTHEVYICDTLCGHYLDKVLCHELTHCFCMSRGIYMSMVEEERLCDFMSMYGRDIIYLLDGLMSGYKFSKKA